MAIDIGGTTIRLALVSDKGEILTRERCPTLAEEGPEPIIDRILSAVNHLLQSNNIKPSRLHSISIAAAGAIDTDNGIITVSPNLPGWIDIPLRGTIEAAHGISTFLLNDANAAALGEHRFGAGKGSSNLVYITVSTGIGGGVISGGQLILGRGGLGGEVGHMTVEPNGPRCNCGNVGCLEALASGPAIARQARELVDAGARTSIADLAADQERITAKLVHEAADQGDAVAVEHQPPAYSTEHRARQIEQ